jgi:hypothetical protein
MKPWPEGRRRAKRRAAVRDRYGPVMKAAVIRDVGALAEVDDVAEPDGETIEVLAAPINPIDLAVSRGVLATGHPEFPYVPGAEAVGRTANGRIVWIFGGSLGRTSQGTIAERATVGDAYTVDVPEGADAAVAAGLGIAGLAGWLPFAWRAPLTGGEDVLVLGATGSVGLVAVQTAKLLGAARVVAAGRSPAGLERAADLGADATLRLDEHSDLVTAIKEAFGGDGLSWLPRRGRRSSTSASRRARRPLCLPRRCGSRAWRSSDSRCTRSHSTCSPSTTAGSSITPSPATFSSTWSGSRSTRSPTRGDVRRTAPEQSSSSYRDGAPAK